MSDTSDFPTAENNSQIENAITRFERQFARDHSTRIETFFDDQDSDNGDQPLKDNPELVAELIYVEMDLRHEKGQEFTRIEYLQRFPQFKDVVSDAWKRLPNVTEKFAAKDDDLIVSIHKTSAETGTVAELIVDKQGISEVPDQIGKYKNLSFIAKGGFGLVYKALDEESKQNVALKFPRMRRQNGRIVDSSAMQLIFEEASKSSHLDHPGIVRTIATETIDKFVFVVQEFVDGQDLRATLSKNRSHIEIAQLIAKTAEALGYANHERIVHRDLKPANILLTKNDEPKIADFGLAFHDSIQVDLPDGRCGTPFYMSPELVQGLNKQLDGRTDIWSLGVIFYEMLAGERPFIGKNETEIFKQIETRDPKPLRQIDPSIDLELEWICLKCLEKRPSDRFSVAKDLADHLWKWIDNQSSLNDTTDSEQSDTPTHTRKETAILPRGLRSYGREDADAFMQLLPGLRDHKGVPSSIRFWQVRIREPVADENRVPVGVIYGPSGSGKSSFVKAGLLPNLGNAITSIYVESTREDTEVRIIKALRRRFPDIPNDKSLPQIFSGLVDGDWGTARQKILIVIDQFEQRLSINDDYDQSQLAKAIKHCDGQRVQCLLLVRDDFWIGLTRFTESIEMNLLVGQNSQDIDLFDIKHARNVLVKLGQAYDRLPQNKQFESLSKNEKAFVKEAVEQLSDGNQVICVRLALFAEMFKDRDWSREELKKVGGVQGVGETFLESTFGSESNSKKYQLQKNAAQAVLSELLPDTGTDIRGSMKSEADLRQAAGMENRPERFKELIDTLDNELKLVTRTSPDESAVENSRYRREASNYQLTHDYLIRSIRLWLDKTEAGRRISRFKELANHYSVANEKQFLPTPMEHIKFQFSLPKMLRNQHSKFWKASTRKAFYSISLGLFVVIALVAVTWGGIRYDQYLKLEGALTTAIECESEAFRHAANEVLTYGNLAQSGLRIKTSDLALPNEARYSSKELRLDLLSLYVGNKLDKKRISTLIDRVVTDFTNESKNLTFALSRSDNLDLVKSIIRNRWDSTNLTMQTKYASILAALGDFGLAAALAKDLQNPTGRSLFIHHYGDFVFDWRRSIEFLANKNIDQDLQYSLILAVGNTFDNSVGFEASFDQQLQKLLRASMDVALESNDAGVVAAAKWLIQNAHDSLRDKYSAPNSLKIEMVEIPSGKLRRRIDKELDVNGFSFRPSEPRAIGRFLVSRTEITNDMFYKFLEDSKGTRYAPFAKWDYEDFSSTRSKPVEKISLNDACQFCNWLSARYDLDEYYQYNEEDEAWGINNSANGFRLPNELEFEFASRAFATSTFSFGDLTLYKYRFHFGNCASPSKIKQNADSVGSFMPNRFGLHDMMGNANEICWPSPENADSSWISSGGSYRSVNQELFCFYNLKNQNPIMRLGTIGFRVCRNYPREGGFNESDIEYDLSTDLDSVH